jgi:hypothetical protein
MRTVLTILAGTAFVAALAMRPAPVVAAEMTIKGEVVDIACATSKGDGGKGAGHAGCAMACAKKGNVLGVLTGDAIYQITGDYAANNNAKLLDFVAKMVTASGDVTEQGGKKMIAVKTMALAK